MASARSDELFYIDENGQRSDAALHDAMIEGVDEEFKRLEIAECRREALERGVDPKTIDMMYLEPRRSA